MGGDLSLAHHLTRFCRFSSIQTLISCPSTWGPWTKSETHIQYLSDLHLERFKYEGFSVNPAAPYLLLVGDIGRFTDYHAYRAFLLLQCERFEKVLLIAGNHEFYGATRQEGLDAASRLEWDPGLQGKLLFMNRARFDIPGTKYTILGRTLHSHIASNFTKLTNDFQRIKDWRVAHHNAEHQRDLDWLQASLTELAQSGRRVIVATHYAPAFEKTTHPANENNAVSQCFSSDTLKALDAWQGSGQVSHWIFGHTHWNTKFKHGRVRLLSNQLSNDSQNLSWWQKRVLYRPFDPVAKITV